jgi:hypothetical protein
LLATLALYLTTWYARKAKARNKGALLHPSVIGSKQRPPMKKEETPKHKGLKIKTSDEKRGNPKRKGLKTKISDKKRGNLKTQEAQNKDLR